MSHLFPRNCKAPPPLAVRGEGCYLFDADGKAYLDGSGGAAVSCLGHGDGEIIRAIQQQAAELAFAHTGFFSSRPAEALADALIAEAPPGIDRVYLVSGGSEAMESALKLARQYFLETGQPQRRHIIARRQSYHGNTLGALATGGNAWRREPFAPMLMPSHHIAPCYEYRERAADESAEAYGLRAANALEQQIQELGEDSVIAFVAEPVVGATAGAVPPVPGYFKRIREICDRYGVLLILDEVMCGMGRTGSLFACEQDEVRPDILAIAKGLGAGYQPVGAMLCSAEMYQAIEQGSGQFQHGHTYLAHPTAAAAALAVLQALQQRELVQRCRQQGEKLQHALHAAFGTHPHVGDIRGRGLFRGIELVAERDNKTPFAPALGIHKLVKRRSFAAGLICYPMGGTVDGVRGDHILLAPPFIISDAQIDELVDKLGQALQDLPVH